MTREEIIGDCRLILGDCREILPTLAKVDAVVTDPPYGIGFNYASHDDTPEGYGPWLWSIIEKCESLCTDGAPLFVFQAMPNVRRFGEWFPRDWRIYAAAKNFVQMRSIAMQYAFDPVVCWWTKGQPWCAGTRNRDFYIADTAGVIANRENFQKGHPCPRPLDQMTRLIEQWVRPQATALDPFMGSGTTGVACMNLGRKFVGIEIDPGYFDIACRRIEQVYRQPRLFGEAQPEPEQMEML